MALTSSSAAAVRRAMLSAPAFVAAVAVVCATVALSISCRMVDRIARVPSSTSPNRLWPCIPSTAASRDALASTINPCICARMVTSDSATSSNVCPTPGRNDASAANTVVDSVAFSTVWANASTVKFKA